MAITANSSIKMKPRRTSTASGPSPLPNLRSPLHAAHRLQEGRPGIASRSPQVRHLLNSPGSEPDSIKFPGRRRRHVIVRRGAYRQIRSVHIIRRLQGARLPDQVKPGDRPSVHQDAVEVGHAQAGTIKRAHHIVPLAIVDRVGRTFGDGSGVLLLQNDEAQPPLLLMTAGPT